MISAESSSSFASARKPQAPPGALKKASWVQVCPTLRSVEEAWLWASPRPPRWGGGHPCLTILGRAESRVQPPSLGCLWCSPPCLGALFLACRQLLFKVTVLPTAFPTRETHFAPPRLPRRRVEEAAGQHLGLQIQRCTVRMQASEIMVTAHYPPTVLLPGPSGRT